MTCKVTTNNTTTTPFPYPAKKYGIIYADPPWSYNDKITNRPGCTYDAMTVDDICDIPVASIADENCILFIWGTWTHITEVQQVITAWGFDYKTIGFVWIKQYSTGHNILGMGNWTRANTEYCLIATKGHPKRIDAGISQLITTTKREHSKKPHEVRQKIIALMGNDIPRIELFARTIINGWDTWGNDPKLQHKPLEHFSSIGSFEVDSEVIK